MGCRISRPNSSSGFVSSSVLSRKIEVARQTKVLALRDLGIQVIPRDVFALSDVITTCDLSHNRLKALPPNMSRWTKLQSLLLCNNRLTSFPSSLFGSLQALTKLTVANNRLRTLPEDMHLLTSLQVLDCRNNRITNIHPRAFDGLNRLTDLNLSQNQLNELPLSLFSLPAVTHLYVQSNKINSFSEDCAAMKHLQVLDISTNQLTDVPSALLASTSLCELWLMDNKITKEQLMKTEGFELFAERRKKRLDKQIDFRVVKQLNFSLCGLD
eukprot:GHVS01071908.1.p1 GENE.GHVS01071908.1~~GHVS01071908.1.p1  ORF type:complete len:270 (-),score=38.27 GHVS01071908.1:341-1150(-)